MSKSGITFTHLKRKIFKVSNLEIDLLIEALGQRAYDLTLTSDNTQETASAKDLRARLLLLRAGIRVDETKHPM